MKRPSTFLLVICLSLTIVIAICSSLLIRRAYAQTQTCYVYQVIKSITTADSSGVFTCGDMPHDYVTQGSQSNLTPVDITFSGGKSYTTVYGPVYYGQRYETQNLQNCPDNSFAPKLVIRFSKPVSDVYINVTPGARYDDQPYHGAFLFATNLNSTPTRLDTPCANQNGDLCIKGPGVTEITITPETFLEAGKWQFYIQNVTFESETPCNNVSSVELLQTEGTLEDNPLSMGGGKKIFPDKRTPTGAVNQKVRIKSVAPQHSSNITNQTQTLFFKAFDLDDPSTDASPVDVNGSSGGDNRGAPKEGVLSPIGGVGSSNTFSGVTDAYGVVQADFSVSMHPGDNYKIAASNDKAYLDGIVLAGTVLRDAAGVQLPTDKAKVTPMLTVWRKLHVEVDSMGLVAGNQVTGTVTGVAPNTTTNQTTVSTSTKTALEVNRFSNGRLMVNGIGSFPIISNNTSSVTVSGIISSVPNRTSFTLYDDDDFNSNDAGNLLGDQGEDVEPIHPLNIFDTTFRLMQDSDDPNLNVFAPAYIRPSYDWARNAGYNNSSISFGLNVTDSATSIDRQLNLGRNSATSESSGFWVTYMQIGYQHEADEDGDPNGESGTTGVGGSWTGGIDTYSGTIPQGADGAMVYVEAQRDVELNQGVIRLIRTVPHEVGHQFGLKGDDANNAFGIMSYRSDLHLVPEHINILRWRISSPGKP